MVRRAYPQRSVFEVLLPDGDQLWDDELREIDAVLDDEAIVDLVDAALRRGDLKFTLRGKKLKGSWVLVRTRGFPPGTSSRRESWLLIKHRDEFASGGDVDTATARSAISNRTPPEIAKATGGGERAPSAARRRRSQ